MNENATVKIEGVCQYEGCERPAEVLAVDRRHKYAVGSYCEEHATRIAEEDNPEYVVGYPNCGCLIPVN